MAPKPPSRGPELAGVSLAARSEGITHLVGYRPFPAAQSGSLLRRDLSWVVASTTGECDPPCCESLPALVGCLSAELDVICDVAVGATPFCIPPPGDPKRCVVSRGRC
ncbi:hypothetical protein V2G26_015084 [Clonostachys chloroleuca]